MGNYSHVDGRIRFQNAIDGADNPANRIDFTARELRRQQNIGVVVDDEDL
jgi:hypothetical protein